MLTAAHPFGEFLDDLMADHGLNQTGLAERLDYSQGWIAAVRTGRKDPSFDMAARIADRFPGTNEIRVYELIKDARLRTYGGGDMRGYHDLLAA